MPENDTKALLALALFRADPRSEECRDIIHQSLVEIALFTSDEALTETQVCDKISEILEQQVGISIEECKKAIQECLKQDRINKRSGNITLKKDRRDALAKQCDNSVEDEKNFDDRLIHSVENELGASLDAIATTLLCTAVKMVIQKILHEKSVELKRLMAEGKCDYRSLLAAGAGFNPIKALKHEIEPMVRIYALNKQNEVINGIKLFLADINESAARYLISLHHRVFYFQLLNIDPSLLELQKRCFENTKLYLDTNVVIALIFEAHPLHTVVRELITASEALHINLLVSPVTFSELTSKVSQSQRLITVRSEQKATALITNTVAGRQAEPIIATFLMKKQLEPKLNWGGFIGPYEDMETYLMHRGVLVEPEGYDGVRKHEHYNRVWQTIKKVRRPEIFDSIIDHDADNFILIHILRQKYPDNPVIGPCIWLLTLDHSLKKDERKLASIFNVEHSRLIEEWGAILLPFQNLRQFVFSNYISYLIASKFGALIQVPALDFNILNIICNPEFSLNDFFDYPVELQVKMLTGMQKDKNTRELLERANRATTSQEKAQIADEFRSKEQQLLVEENERIVEKFKQLSQEVSQLRNEMAQASSFLGEKEQTVHKLSANLRMAEERLHKYETMSLWDWLKTFTHRK